MLKKILLPALMIATLAGCSDNKAKEKALLDSVTNEHDKVMGYEAIMMKKKAQLKEVLTVNPGLKDSVAYFSKQLDSNDNVMMDWMNKFNPDFTNKSDDQIMGYLTQQKKQLFAIDSNFKKAIDQTSYFVIRGLKK
jgi:hypothetical protein